MPQQRFRSGKGEWSADRSRYKWTFQGHRFTIFKQPGSVNWYVHFSVGGKRHKPSLETTDYEVAVKRAQSEWEKAKREKWLPPKPPEPVAPKRIATIGAVLDCYTGPKRKRGELQPLGVQRVSEKIDHRTVWNNAGAVRLVVRWARGEHGERNDELDVDALSLEALNAALLDAAVTNYKLAAGADEKAIDRRRRGIASMVRQARSVFKPEALRLFRESGLQVPDLTSFLRERRVTAPAAVHRSIEPQQLREMDEAAKELRKKEPALYVVHLATKFLALRPQETEEAQVGWFERAPELTAEGKEWGQFFLLVTVRENSRPKASMGAVPVTKAVMAEFAAMLADRGGMDFLIDATTATARNDLVFREHSKFMRRFLPGADFAKSSYELRRWGIQIMEGRYGREAASAFARHTPKTVTERHYLERWFPWSRFGADIGITLADARGPETKEQKPQQWLRGAAALAAARAA